MSSLKRVLASRANGALSRGPKTLEGKARASQNALRHGLLAKCVILASESPEGFKDLHDHHLARFMPSDGVEDGFVEEMTASRWRMRRLWAIETRILDDALAAQPPGDELGRIAAAFSTLAARPELHLIHRYETRLHTIYQRALYNLLILRTAEVPNEPTPISGPPPNSAANSPQPAPPAERLQLVEPPQPAPSAESPGPQPPPPRAHPPNSGTGSNVPSAARGHCCLSPNLSPNSPQPVQVNLSPNSPPPVQVRMNSA